MLTKPWFEVTAMVDDLRGKMLMKAGSSEQGNGVKGRIVLISNSLTRGSAKGRPCLISRQGIVGSFG